MAHSDVLELPEGDISIGDPVLAPSHYVKDGFVIEPWDFIISHNLGFLEGNIIKYVVRYEHKGDRLGDLRKAKAYLDKLIFEEELKEHHG